MKKLNQILSYAIWGWLGSIAMMLLITISYGVFPEDINGVVGILSVPTSYVFGGLGGIFFGLISEGRFGLKRNICLKNARAMAFIGGFSLLMILGFFSRLIPH
ncbi:MAG: hypothetical protein O3B43_04390 [Chloroflexi bacterium]|nr:hypothetical protein [Chloroflexota bacterium]